MNSTNEVEVKSSKNQCVFYDIIAGKLPAYAIYQAPALSSRGLKLFEGNRVLNNLSKDSAFLIS